MIDKKDLQNVRKKIRQGDLEREELIRKSRDILALSKQVIASVHRNELNHTLITKIENEFKNLNKIAKQNPSLLYCGSFKVAVQEYIEALGFYNLIKHDRLVKWKDFDISADYYLLGLCDLTGEIARKAVNLAISGDHEAALHMKSFVEQLYNELLAMDLRNGELRKKFDGMRYDLKRLEDLALNIKFQK